MNIKKINFNILIALDALLHEKNVTRAGKKLFITQSAMSNILNQCRELFNDELLFRDKKGMQLTEKAKRIKPELHQHVYALQQLVTNQPQFDPENSHRVFHLGLSDMAQLMLLPELTKILLAQAPNIQLKIAHIDHIDSAEEFSEMGYEIIVGAIIRQTRDLCIEKAFTIQSSIVAQKNHPIFSKKITLKNYLSFKHIRIQYNKDNLRKTVLDSYLAKHNKQRNVYLTITDIIPALTIVSQSSLLASIPLQLSKKILAQFKLKQAPLPFKLPEQQANVIFLRQQENDPGLVWLRGIIQTITNKQQTVL